MREARQIAPGAGLAHPEAPRDLGAQRRHEPAVALLDGAGVEQTRRDDPEPLRVQAARDVTPLHLLEVDHLLCRRRVPAAELGRPPRDEPAGVEELALPRARPVGQVRARLLRLREHVGCWCVLVEPRVELGTEPLRRVTVREPHHANGSRYVQRQTLRVGSRARAGERKRGCSPASERPRRRYPAPQRASEE